METNRLHHVLIVEDEYINAWSLAVILQPHFRIRHSATAEEALYWMHRETYRFIMMDIGLGENRRAGLELLPFTLKIQPNALVFATTGMGIAGERDSFLAEGFHDYYPKPIVAEQVLADLLRQCSRGKAA